MRKNRPINLEGCENDSSGGSRLRPDGMHGEDDDFAFKRSTNEL